MPHLPLHPARWALPLVLLGGTLPAFAQDALAAKYACVACHNAERKVVGPSWKDIATKYAGGAKSAEALAQSIKKGGAGNWGQVPMPPQPTLPDPDALALSRWILATKP